MERNLYTKDYWAIYKITIKGTNYVYVGQHKYPSTKSLDTDTYMGSGVSIRKYIKKYGKSSAQRSWIKVGIESQEQADFYERKYIAEANRDKNVKCLNRAKGGAGSRDSVFCKRPIICKEDNTIFASSMDAELKLKTLGIKLDHRNIEDVCKGRHTSRKTCGDGRHWVCYSGQSDFATTDIAIKYRTNNVFIYSYQNNKVYKNIIEASLAENIESSSILYSCDNSGRSVMGKRFCFINIKDYNDRTHYDCELLHTLIIK